MRLFKALRRLLLFMFWASVQLCWAQPTAVLRDAEFNSLKEVSHLVLETSSPNKSVYVGIGRSPVGIIAYLSQLPNVQAGLVPLSSARNFDQKLINLKTSSDPKSKEYFVKLQQGMDQHLRAFLDPLIQNRHGRKLVFIDYVVNGGLQSALYILDDFLKRNYPDVEYDFLALTTEANQEKNKSWLPKEKSIFLNQHWPLERQFIKSFYSEWAPYGEFSFLSLTSGKTVELRGEYQQLLTEIRQRISNESNGHETGQVMSCERAVGI